LAVDDFRQELASKDELIRQIKNLIRLSSGWLGRRCGCLA